MLRGTGIIKSNVSVALWSDGQSWPFNNAPVTEMLAALNGSQGLTTATFMKTIVFWHGSEGGLPTMIPQVGRGRAWQHVTSLERCIKHCLLLFYICICKLKSVEVFRLCVSSKTAPRSF